MYLFQISQVPVDKVQEAIPHVYVTQQLLIKVPVDEKGNRRENVS